MACYIKGSTDFWASGQHVLQDFPEFLQAEGGLAGQTVQLDLTWNTFGYIWTDASQCFWTGKNTKKNVESGRKVVIL